jgi:restriction system protein
MAKRGVMAEINRQMKASAREAERRNRAAVTAHNAAAREAERARKAEERARAAAQRATEQEQKQLEKEAAAAHVAAMQAEVDERNAALAEVYDEIDCLLQASLEVDDYVDLETLRQVAEHPDFDRPELETPTPLPLPIPEPSRPTMPTVEAPKGLIGRRKKLEQAQAQAQAKYEAAEQAYEEQMRLLPRRHEADARAYAEAEERRTQELARERHRYAEECAARDAQVAEANQELDSLVANLGYGTVDAVQEYVTIVLSNSEYPAHFPVEHEATFDPATAELTLAALIPPPDAIPTTKAFKYVKASDEIAETPLSQKACKDRYLDAVQAVALRSLHEIFEADRRGLIKTISLEVGTNTIDPATGKPTRVLFAAVGAERNTFLEFDLSSVVPAATLEHLGAAVSKNPYGLVAIKSSGVRQS